MNPQHTNRPAKSAAPHRGGFTLIELLSVMVIIGMLLAFAGVGLQTALSSHKLSASVGTFRNEIGWAAIESAKDNRPVHLRLYKFLPEETVGDDAQFYAYQFLVVDSRNSRMDPITEVRRFGDGVIAHPNIEYSSILSLAEKSPDTEGESGVIADPELLLPAYTYVEFQLRPDGSTDLPKDGKWSLTFVESKRIIGGTADLPKDYRAVVVSPFTAATRIY